MSLDDLHATCVNQFNSGEQRRYLYECLQRFFTRVSSYVSFKAWIDGSFVTHKDEPGDIDLILVLNEHEFGSLPVPQQRELYDLLSDPDRTNAQYNCHAFATLDTDPTTQQSWFDFFKTGYDNVTGRGLIEVSVPYHG